MLGKIVESLQCLSLASFSPLNVFILPSKIAVMTPSSTHVSWVLGSWGKQLPSNANLCLRFRLGSFDVPPSFNSYSSPSSVSLTGDICLHITTSGRKLSTFFILHLAFYHDFSFCLSKKSLLSKLNLGRCALVYPGSHSSPSSLQPRFFFVLLLNHDFHLPASNGSSLLAFKYACFSHLLKEKFSLTTLKTPSRYHQIST